MNLGICNVKLAIGADLWHYIYMSMEGAEKQNTHSKDGEIEGILEDSGLSLVEKAERVFGVFSENGIEEMDFLTAINGLAERIKEEDVKSLKERLTGLEQVDPENPLRKFLMVLLSYKETRDALADSAKKKV